MSKKITSYQTAEFGKFEEIVGSSEYPPVSVTRISYPDTTNAFPSNSAVEPLSSIEVYPKYAVLTKLINPEDIKVSLSAQNINMNLDEIELNTDEIESLIANSNTLLASLTSITQTEFDQTQTLLDALTSLQNSKQDEVITLLSQLTANTDSLEVNTDDVEALLSGSNSRLDALTAIDYATSSKQDQIITLLHSISGYVSEVDINVNEIESNVDQVETLLNDLTASNVNVPGFSIPPYDEISFNYVGSTDIFRTVTYLKNSTQVMSLSFTYVTEPPTTGNAIIQSVKKV
jgi:copper chaperone CopZ